MRERVADLSRARVLLSNDDGINAPGLKILEGVMRKLAREVWVVAPETEQSAASHSLTLRRPLRIRKVSARRFAVDGTPSDSVLLGISQAMKDNPPDLVISGVNRGGNLGEDVIYSGTVAAALEGTLLGFPAIALSQVTRDQHPIKWSTAEQWIEKVLSGLVGLSFPPNVMVNVNFPDVPAAAVDGIEVTRQGKRKLGGDLSPGVDPRGEPYFWIGPLRIEDRYRKGTDLEAATRGKVSITPLCVDMTDAGMLKKLRGVF